MTDKLDGVATFVQVVDAGSFTTAAIRMDLTRSAVGKVITRLEARLGVRLLNRTTRTQTLTEAGHAYYNRCVRALAELDEAEAELETERSVPRGRLRVSVPIAFGHLCVAPVLFALAQRHAHLQVDLSFTDRYVDLVEEGIDLAIRIGSLGDSSSLSARTIGVQHHKICAAPSYLARCGTPRSDAQIDGHEGIMYSRAGVVTPWQVRSENSSVRELRTVLRLSLDDVQAIAGAAVAGFGLAQLPCWLLARFEQAGELVEVRGRAGLPSQEIHAVWPTTRYLPLKTRVAIDALAMEIPAMMPE
jgi:DNA-binding transcriptional LysR family regulator